MARVDLAGKLSDARARVTAETTPTAPPAPMFAQLARKDARIRDDQVTALAAVADVVMRRRRFKAERITENTLIRIAIDLLLAHADRLRGSTEDELRNSVTSGLPKPVSPALTDSGPSGVTAPESAMVAPAAAPDTPACGAAAPAANLGTSDVREFGSLSPSPATGLEVSP